MLPLGVLDCGKRSSRFTPDEQRTVMTLWAIVRSPLMHGGDLTKTDAPTLSLLTNREVLEVNQRSSQNRELFSRDGTVAWLAAVPDSEDRYLALFNTKSRVDLSSERAAFSGVVTSKPGSSSTKGASLDIDVEVAYGWRPWHASPTVHSFANFGRTTGGTHVKGLLDALDALRKTRRRDLERGLVAAVAVVLADVRYGNPTKDAVVTPEVHAAVRTVGREVLAAWAAANPEARDAVLARSG